MKLFASMIVLGLLAGIQFQAHADEAKTGENFDKNKSELIADIDERIAKLGQHKSCVQSAADREALKKCHEAMKDFRHEQRVERMEKKRDRLDEKIQKAKAPANK